MYIEEKILRRSAYCLSPDVGRPSVDRWRKIGLIKGRCAQKWLKSTIFNRIVLLYNILCILIDLKRKFLEPFPKTFPHSFLKDNDEKKVNLTQFFLVNFDSIYLKLGAVLL